MLKITIISVNLNNLSGLKKTVNSVISQDYTNFEYIIIDGGSNDGSAEYIQSISRKLKYYISEKDYGIYSAMNKGILKSNGDYLIFLNSGDYFYSPES
ncbi:MAG: glycosyltransferase, partial [Chitinophagaceae bacterium]